MPTLDEHHSSKYLKLVMIGDSGTGKTGAMTSLVCAGYNLKVLDTDNGLDALRNHVRKQCPDLLKNVDYETRRDVPEVGPYQFGDKTITGPHIKRPKAFVDSLKLMEKWTDDSDPSEWGEGTIFVLDSMTTFGKSAYEWARGMNPTAKDPRQWYFAAQQAVESTIALLTSEAFRSNVIIISHINYRELQDGTTKGYPSAVGSAMGPTVAKYFNTLLICEAAGSGESVRRRIRTVPTAVIDAKNPSPFSVDATYPLETGLASIFEKLKGQNDDA